jgi:transposase
MSRKYQSYTDEVKQEAVRLVTEQGYKIAKAARSLGVHENLLCK